MALAGQRSGLTILHLAPHPDDEIIGAGATLLGMREAGHRVVNLACSLGRPADHDRRRAEVERASARAGFELIVHDPPLATAADDDLDAAQAALERTIDDLVRRESVAILVSSSPHDGHHGHEVVGRAAREALRRMGPDAPVWWMWGLWADLPLPTLVTEFDAARLATVIEVLRLHIGEVERNDYPAMVEARAVVSRVLGAERAFGFGSPGLEVPYAELLTEAVQREGRWVAPQPRVLDPADPLAATGPHRALDWWLDAPSVSRRLREG